MAEPIDLAVKERKELELRRAQMARNPFCPDHRDKVYGKPCRECEIEHLARIDAAQHLADMAAEDMRVRDAQKCRKLAGQYAENKLGYLARDWRLRAAGEEAGRQACEACAEAIERGEGDMMPTDTPLAKDDPLDVAWELYKSTEDYANTRRWALYEAHVDGSLWAAFAEGWKLRAIERGEG